MFDVRLIRAEILKLRRRLGMLALTALMTCGAMVIGFAVLIAQHASDPTKHGPAGGLTNYQDAIHFLVSMALVAGAIVGATAGAQDLESGVFRDSAATGRSRVALFAARVPGAWAVLLPIVAAAAAIPAVLSVTLAGSLAAPTAGALAAGTASALAAAALSSAVAVGLAALVGSRGPVIGILLASELAVFNLLMGFTFLGGARKAIPNVALDRIGDAPGQAVAMTLAAAIVVVLGWAAAAFAAGAWKTATREI
jgi:hypothetical protein